MAWDQQLILHFLPALPTAWSTGKVLGLRARGGFEVDLEWRPGALEKATIRAIRDGEFRVCSNGKLSVDVLDVIGHGGHGDVIEMLEVPRPLCSRCNSG